jgi:pimeloyl-ACP methyl ester carboxylesterase
MRPSRRERVIALHCSGAGAGQWRHLGDTLGAQYHLFAPEHYGCASTGSWTGEHAFRLADEAARTIALFDEWQENIHLVGHSYGGAIALHVALARPDQIASMVLYEPSAFHLLRQLGAVGAEAANEIEMVAQRTRDGIVSGDYRGCMTAFVNYWNGAGAWDAMAPDLQRSLIRWAPKGPLDFQALLHEPTRRACAEALAPDCANPVRAVAEQPPGRRRPGRPHGPADPCGRGVTADRQAHRRVPQRQHSDSKYRKRLRRRNAGSLPARG